MKKIKQKMKTKKVKVGRTEFRIDYEGEPLKVVGLITENKDEFIVTFVKDFNPRSYFKRPKKKGGKK